MASSTILQESIWNGSLPLEIRISPTECRIYDKADPYLVRFSPCPSFALPDLSATAITPFFPPLAAAPHANLYTSKQSKDLYKLTHKKNPPPQIQFSRLSYLPFLLPRLHAFFSPFLIDPDLPPHCGWFSFEEIPLKWHYPLGLLFDLFSGAAPSLGSPSTTTTTTTTTNAIEAGGDGGSNNNNNHTKKDEGLLPWRLLLHFREWPDEQLVRLDAEGKVLHDAYINSVKEADFLRNGTAKGIMSLSKDDSTRLWHAVEERTFFHLSPSF